MLIHSQHHQNECNMMSDTGCLPLVLIGSFLTPAALISHVFWPLAIVEQLMANVHGTGPMNIGLGLTNHNTHWTK